MGNQDRRDQQAGYGSGWIGPSGAGPNISLRSPTTSANTIRPDRSLVLVALRVRCSSDQVFARFTGEIGQSRRPNGLFPITEDRTGTLSSSRMRGNAQSNL